MTMRISALLAALGIIVAACAGGGAAPSAGPSRSPAPSPKEVKAQIFVFSNSSPNVTVIDGETRKIVRTKDIAGFTSWTWNDDNNYFDGTSLWLGLRNPTTNDAEVIALNLDSLEITRRIALGQEKLSLYIGKATRSGLVDVGKMGSGQVVGIDAKLGAAVWTRDVPVNGDVVCDADVATLADGSQRLFYPTRKGDTLVALNAQTGETLKVVSTPTGATPLMLTVAPDNRVWVQESGSNTNAVFDPATLDLVKRFPAAKGPVVATFSPDGKRAYIGHSGDPVVDVFDTATYSLVTRVEVGSTPDKIAVDPSGGFIYPILSKEGAVAVVDTATWTVIDRIALGTNPSGIFLRTVR